MAIQGFGAKTTYMPSFLQSQLQAITSKNLLTGLQVTAFFAGLKYNKWCQKYV
jgi:hypothetical protein